MVFHYLGDKQENVSTNVKMNYKEDFFFKVLFPLLSCRPTCLLVISQLIFIECLQCAGYCWEQDQQSLPAWDFLQVGIKLKNYWDHLFHCVLIL